MWRGLWPGRAVALTGIVLIALNMRTAVSSISPIAGAIDNDVALSNVALGVLGTLPPAAFALAGIFGPRVSRRLGIERTLLIAIIAMIVGPLIRAAAPTFSVLAIGGTVALAGMGTSNVILPAMVKKYFADRVGLVTSIYATFIALSASLPALLAPRIAEVAGWRVSVATWALVALIALVPWLYLVRRHQPAPIMQAGADEKRSSVRLARSPTVWAITVVFAVGTLGFYSMFAVLPVLLVDAAEVSTVRAGELLSLYGFAIIPLSILVPGWAARMHTVTPLVVAGVALSTFGYGGLLLSPAWSPWLWVASAGLGGLLFPLALVLIGLRTHTPEAAVAVSGFVQSVAYFFAGVGPFIVALLQTATGAWDASLIFLLTATLAALPAGLALSRRRFVDDEIAASGVRSS